MNYQETQTVKWSSKAQIGMMEMIMVMVVITILLVIGMVFYFKFSASSIEKTGETITEETAAVIVSTIVQLPEIECSYLGSRSTKTCADTIKLLALSEKDKETNSGFIEHRRHYSNLFGYMTIKFEQLYPEPIDVECDDETFMDQENFINQGMPTSCKTWTIYNNPKKGANVEETPFRTMPIALYYPPSGIYTFGQLKIYMYE